MGDTIITEKIFKVPVGIIEFLATLGRPLQGSRVHNYLVEAKNKTQARLRLTKEKSFWKNYNKLPVKERKNLGVFRLRREGKIEEILACEKRHKNMRGDYTCGEPIHSIKNHEDKDNEMFNMNGEFGMCCIEDYSPFDSPDCPYNTS